MNYNNLPEGWRIEKINNIAIVSAGQGAPQNESDYGDDGYSFIKAGNLEFLCNGGSEREIPKINDSIAIDKKLRLYDKGTIIFAKSGMSCMKERVYALKEPCYIVNHLACIISKGINSKYLMYFLKRNPPTRLIKDMSYPSIRLSDIEKMEVILPPLETQKKIVEVLEKAEKVIEKRKEVIKLLDELVKSRFIGMFGDPVLNAMKLPKVRLGKIGCWKTGGTPSRSNNEYYNGNIPWLSSGELNTMYCFNSAEMITELAIKESAAKIIEKGSLLLGMYDTAALKSTINMIECSCNQAIAYAKLEEKLVNTIYVYYCIQIGKDFYKSQQRGVRQKNLNLSMIKELEILMPDLRLQNEFADFVNQVDKLKFEMESSLKELENNFNSLMQKAFNGELFN